MAGVEPEDQLQAFYDGELPADQARAVADRVEREPELAARLAGLERLSTLVRLGVAEGASEVDAEALFEKVAAGIATASAGGGASATGASATGASATGASTGTVHRLPSAHSLRRPTPEAGGQPKGLRVWLPVACTLAIAAGALLFLWPPDPGESAASDRGPAPSAVAQRDSGGDVSEVVDFDLGDRSGSVFSVEGERGAQYAVVWLSDADPGRP